MCCCNLDLVVVQDRSPPIAHLRAVAVDYVLQTQIVGIASGASHIVDTFQLKLHFFVECKPIF